MKPSCRRTAKSFTLTTTPSVGKGSCRRASSQWAMKASISATLRQMRASPETLKPHSRAFSRLSQWVAKGRSSPVSW